MTKIVKSANRVLPDEILGNIIKTPGVVSQKLNILYYFFSSFNGFFFSVSKNLHYTNKQIQINSLKA